MLVVGREGKCGSQCNFEERRSVREEILRGAVARPRKLFTSQVGERVEKNVLVLF